MSAVIPAVPEGEFDPSAEMVSLARRLAEAYAADTSNALLARELRVTLLAVRAPDAVDAELAEFFEGFRRE